MCEGLKSVSIAPVPSADSGTWQIRMRQDLKKKTGMRRKPRQRTGRQLTRSNDAACAGSSAALAEWKNPNLATCEAGNLTMPLGGAVSALTRPRPKSHQLGIEQTREILKGRGAPSNGR